MPPALATSHQTSWKTLFGNSTNCGLGAVSINDSTHKAGARTVNRRGCDFNNAAVAVPADSLYAHAYLNKADFGICSPDVGAWNASSTDSFVITSELVVSSYCPSNGTYSTVGSNARRSAAGDVYPSYRQTNTFTFN